MTIRDLEVIRKLDFFEPLDNKIIKSIAQQCFEREFALGDFIVRQGESGLGLYFISSGRARVEIDHLGSRVAVAEVGPGDCVGELSIMDEKSRSASVVCIENTKCLLLTRESFSRLMNKYPQIAVQMVKALAGRLRATDARILESPQAAAPPPNAPNEPAHPKPQSAAGSAERATFPLSTPSGFVESYTAMKGKVKDLLLDVFTPIYAARAMTRFSMAVIGCPVTVRSEDATTAPVAAIVNDVKVCFFPAGVEQTLRIDAFSDGDVSVSVLQARRRWAPAVVSHLRASMKRNQNWRLHVPSRGPIWMEATRGEAIDAGHSR